MSTSTASRLLEPWAVPWPVLRTAFVTFLTPFVILTAGSDLDVAIELSG